MCDFKNYLVEEGVYSLADIQTLLYSVKIVIQALKRIGVNKH